MQRLILVRRVEGHSMEPTLRPGQLIIACGYIIPKVGKIVIAYHKGREIVKRVKAVHSNQIELIGDNIQTAHNAVVKPSAIIATVCAVV